MDLFLPEIAPNICSFLCLWHAVLRPLVTESMQIFILTCLGKRVGDDALGLLPMFFGSKHITHM